MKKVVLIFCLSMLDELMKSLGHRDALLGLESALIVPSHQVTRRA